MAQKYLEPPAPKVTMLFTATRGITPKHLGKAAGVLLLLSALAFLAGCQGLSAAGQPSGPSALSLPGSSVDFGSVAAGANKTVTVTATNSGGETITIQSAAISTKYFSLTGTALPLTIPAGQTASISLTFSPNAAGNFSATLAITSDAMNPQLSVTLSGTGTATAPPPGQLTLNPTSEAFGSVTVGSKQTHTVTLTNTGGSDVNISQASVSGTGFQLSGITAPLMLTPSQSTTLTVAFAPQSSGSINGAVTITSDASNSPLTMGLSGTGVSLGALASSPTSLSFNSVTVGSNQSLSETVTNTGGTSVLISQVGISGTGLSLSGITAPVTLTAGQSATFQVKFAPASAGSVNGNVTITSNATNSSLTIPVSGTGVAPGDLGSNPTSLSFNDVTVGSSQSLSETITNTGGMSVTISQAGISGTGLSLSGIATPVTLTAGQSATFTVNFAQTAAGSVNGSVTVTSNASNPSLIIPVSGTGVAAVGQLAVNPTTLGLGNVVVGTNGTGSGSLSASGASVTVTAASSNNSAFGLSGITLPVTIPAGQSASFTVTFRPQSAGAASAQLTFTSNAQTSTTVETLTGTGTAARAYTVSLSWTASTSTEISGYNIYRAKYSSSCGAFSKINSVLNTGTLYSDSVVSDGSAYCYATTAVDTSNEESGYSNIVSNVQIPAP